MYTETSNYKEMVVDAKAKGIETKNIKKVDLIAALNATVEAKIEKRGRPINPQSNRQIKISQVGIGQGHRGRPANPESAWNKRQAELNAKRDEGTLKLGRAINPTSARQIRLSKKGTLPLGRPKQVKPEVPAVAEAQA